MKLSRLGRSLDLAKLAVQVGFKELRSGGAGSRLDQAVLIANSLSKLKGAAMKAGQLLSLDLDNYFPPEAIEILGQLQSGAIAHPHKEILEIIKNELPANQFSKMQDFAVTPIGVASIGQVHRAVFAGKDIVLKVQYPGVADSIDSDLKILKTLAHSFCQITGRTMDLNPLFAEFRKVLEQEVDYVAEAQFQKQYRSQVLTIKSGSSFSYHVPEVIDSLSSKRVLAMTYETGLSIRSWLATNPDLEKRTQLAEAILDLYFHEFFEWGLVQTDPNWANFLIHESQKGLRLVILDFGATRKYSRDFIQNYIKLLNLTALKDYPSLKKHAIEFGLIDSRESPLAFQAFQEMLTTAIQPFFAKESGDGFFDFSDKNHSLQSQKDAKSLARELVYSPPPYNLVFLNRKLAGVYSILKSLKVRLDVSSYWEKMAELASKGD